MTTRRAADDLVISATGLLADFNRAGVLQVPDVQVAQILCRMQAIGDPQVQLAAALAVRQLRAGSVCVDLSTIRDQVLADLDADEDLALGGTDPDVASLPWPQVDAWVAAVGAHPQVGGTQASTNAQPFRLIGSLFYLTRWWSHENVVATRLITRQSATPPVVDIALLEGTLTELFPAAEADGDDLQRRAASVAARSWTTVVAGGPGTGKTTTVARLLAVLASQSHRPLTVALAAPSGKAAARLEQSVRSEAASMDRALPPIPAGQTLHRLLGSRGLGNGFTHDASNPLPHDVVVVDEASMVDVSMFASLLTALRDTTRLVIVGDPHQLSSVDAGRVLADICALGFSVGPGSSEQAVVELQRNWRNAGNIHDLAQAIKAGDADLAVQLLASGDASLEWVSSDSVTLTALPEVCRDVVSQARDIQSAAMATDPVTALAALDRHRILTAHRQGTHGVTGWTHQVRDLIRESLDGYAVGPSEWYPGRPILVTANSRDINVFNGDAGVIVRTAQGPHLALPTPGGAPRLIAPSLVDGLESMYALTVHKSQGSQFDSVTVVLPSEGSPLLTRELLYTAVTRAVRHVRVIGTEAAVRAAVQQHSQRSSGLTLEPAPPGPPSRP